MRDEDPWKREDETKKMGISPLLDPGRDNVKQGKTGKDKKRQLMKKGAWERGTSGL